MVRISITVHPPYISELFPLMSIEDDIERMLECTDLMHFRIRRMNRRLDALNAFTFNAFTICQHRRVLDLFSRIDQLGLELPTTDPLYGKFKRLRERVNTKFSEYREALGLDLSKDLWKHVSRYKNRLTQFPRKLTYLATKEALNALQPKPLTESQQESFECCNMLRTVDEFDQYTNIRKYTQIEMCELVLEKHVVDLDLYVESKKIREYLERIFTEFVPMRDAWNWTLLKYVKMTPSFKETEYYSQRMAAKETQTTEVVQEVTVESNANVDRAAEEHGDRVAEEQVAKENVDDAAEQHVNCAAEQHVNFAAEQHVNFAAEDHVESAAEEHVDRADEEHVDNADEEHVYCAAEEHVECATEEHVAIISHEMPVQEPTAVEAEKVADVDLDRIPSASTPRTPEASDVSSDCTGITVIRSQVRTPRLLHSPVIHQANHQTQWNEQCREFINSVQCNLKDYIELQMNRDAKCDIYSFLRFTEKVILQRPSVTPQTIPIDEPVPYEINRASPPIIRSSNHTQTVAAQIHRDELSDSPKLDSAYVPPVIDLNETRQVIESHLDDAYSNPFDEEIKAAFLEQCDFVEYLKNLEVCVMVKTLRPIVPKSQLDIGDRSFDVQALVGKGNYGHVFSSQCQATGNQYALKQERPANLWEYYICLEIESRISDVPNMLNAFMTVECALIGNNASLLVSPFGRYGTMIDVCNKVRLSTTKNIPEPVVMMLAIQILSVVDHLHACKIIHADIKPDNILLVRRLSYDHHEICVQLIDFGQAIDMKLYPDKQVFRSKLTTRNFVCTEMMDDKPWTYQTDLFCVAATIYTLLFGADMKVRKAPLGYSLVTSIPRYYCKWMWESIFNALINIKDCRTMPNLQSLRNMLLHEVSNEKERATKEAIVRFNNIINAK